MFYTFRQNNSGGSFVGPVLLCVECDSLDDANVQAERHGFQFGMVGSCECCGPRWPTAYGVNFLTETPTYYGDPLPESGTSWTLYYRDGLKFSGGRNVRYNDR